MGPNVLLARIAKPLTSLSKGGVAGLLSVLLVAGLVTFVVAARWVNTEPAQCASCHPEVSSMWRRSQGHPSHKVSCHQCHAAHGELPESLNVATLLRDQWIPEKYKSADLRVEARCKGCHPKVLVAGTGPALVTVKETLKQVSQLLAADLSGGGEVQISSRWLASDLDGTEGSRLFSAVLRGLRNREWRMASHAARSDAVTEEALLDRLRGPLQFSSQSLRWARIDRAKVADGVNKRVGKRLNQLRAGMGNVRRGIEQLQQIFLFSADHVESELKEIQVSEALALLESMSKGLKSAGRAREALLKELAGLDDAIVNPDALARPLKTLPRSLKSNDLQGISDALREGAEFFEDPLFDQARIEARSAERSGELAFALESKLAGLRNAVAMVLSDLPPASPVDSVSAVRIRDARIVVSEDSVLPIGEKAQIAGLPSPERVVDDLLTAIRSLQVSLESVPNLGWADFSLSDGHVDELLSGFGMLKESFSEIQQELPERSAIRVHLERILAALVQAREEDSASLVFVAFPTTGGDGLSADGVNLHLTSLVNRSLDALNVVERQMESSNIIKVNHKVHFALTQNTDGQPVQLGCIDCHRNIAHDKAQLETNRPRMASCFTGNCHRKDRNKDNCRRCHFQHLTEIVPSAL